MLQFFCLSNGPFGPYFIMINCRKGGSLHFKKFLQTCLNCFKMLKCFFFFFFWGGGGGVFKIFKKYKFCNTKLSYTLQNLFIIFAFHLCHISENIDIAAGSDPIILAVLILIINLVVMEEKHYVPAGAAAPIYCCRASLPGEASNISEKTFHLDFPSFLQKKEKGFHRLCCGI